MTRTLAVAALLLAALVSLCARAAYPDRPLRLIVPQAAASATDTVARLVAAELSVRLGQQVVVENRPGGALTLGIDMTAKAAPDGYTLGVGPIGALAITRHMVAKLPYVIERDLQPVVLIVRGQLVLAVSPEFAARSVAELIALARKEPGRLANASSSNGSPGHVSGELFKSMTGTQIVHIPYKGGAQAINDLIAGHVHLMFESLNSMAPHVRSGKVRALAVTGATRAPGFPDVPTIAEAGVAGYEATSWVGLIAPAGVPRPIIERLNTEVNRALGAADFKAKLALAGGEPGGGTPEDFAELIRRDSAKWADVVKRTGARID